MDKECKIVDVEITWKCVCRHRGILYITRITRTNIMRRLYGVEEPFAFSSTPSYVQANTPSENDLKRFEVRCNL